MRTTLLAIAIGIAAAALPATDARAQTPDGSRRLQNRFDADHRAIDEKLRTRRVTLDFTDAPLGDVVSFLRQVLGVNLLVDPGVYQASGAEVLQVTLNVKDIRADHAIDLLLRMNGLIRTYKNGVLLLTTKDRHTEETYLVVYDVRDMLFSVKDFKGPDIRLTSAGSSSTPGVVFGGGDDDDTGKITTPEALIELVQANAVTESWDSNEEVSVALAGGMLVVNQTRSGHYEVGRFLGMLRQFR